MSGEVRLVHVGNQIGVVLQTFEKEGEEGYEVMLPNGEGASVLQKPNFQDEVLARGEAVTMIYEEIKRLDSVVNRQEMLGRTLGYYNLIHPKILSIDMEYRPSRYEKYPLGELPRFPHAWEAGATIYRGSSGNFLERWNREGGMAHEAFKLLLQDAYIPITSEEQEEFNRKMRPLVEGK